MIVRDPKPRKQIRAAAVDQAQVIDVSLLIALTADLKAWKKSTERYWRNASLEIQKLAVGWTVPFYEGKEQLQRDEVMRSCGIVGQTILLAAKATGYDSCPMIGSQLVNVAEIIKPPGNHVISFMLAFGKAVKSTWPKGGQLALSEVVVQDRLVTLLASWCILDVRVSPGGMATKGVFSMGGKHYTEEPNTFPPAASQLLASPDACGIIRPSWR